MNKLLPIDIRAVRKVVCVMVAVLVAVGGLPLLFNSNASAVQLASRSIQLSDSGASGTSITSGVGSGANVSYKVTFTTGATSGETHSLVIDFCSNDPIIQDTCTAPTGMVATAATLNATAVSGTVQTTTDNWAVTAGASQIKLADDGTAGHGMAQNTTESFVLSGITNPSTVGTYYARIYTYTANSWTGYTNAGSIGTDVDFGGIALSTTAVIQITARVQEQLTFCVSAADPNTWTGTPNVDCSDAQVAASPPTIIIGHGTPTKVIDATAVDTANVWDQLSTNATHGAIINMRNSNTTCGGLSADSGTTCAIPPVNAGAGTGAVTMAAGTAAFGLRVTTYAVTSPNASQTGAIDPTTEYNNGANTFGMDTTTSGNNVESTYGSTIANAHTTGVTAGPVYEADDQLTFAAGASLTTPAGIYTANMNLIATGTF
jgi:hypothetical protein